MAAAPPTITSTFQEGLRGWDKGKKDPPGGGAEHHVSNVYF